MSLKPIEPNPPRWEPAEDPNDIVVPGLDTTASVYDQLEQIEQLITIKLQNIDANFSRMQDIMANRILPAVKRYAVGTEPVREAAKFWTTFYEQAAQINVPTYDDYSLHEQPEPGSQSQSQSTTEADPAEVSAASSTEEGEAPHTPSGSAFNPDGTVSEVSFMPGQAAISSTPATTSRHRSLYPNSSYATQGHDATPSWTASLESPLLRLDREVSNLIEDDEVPLPASPSPVKKSSVRGSSIVSTSNEQSFATPRAPITSAASRSAYLAATAKPATPKYNIEELLGDEDFEMSPPVTLQFAKVPKLGRTPKKEVAGRIMDKLLDVERRIASRSPGRVEQHSAYEGGIESSMSSAPTPPSTSRYNRHQYPSAPNMSNSLVDASLESMMRRVGLDIPGFGGEKDIPNLSTTSTTSIASARAGPVAGSSGHSVPPTTSALSGTWSSRHLAPSQASSSNRPIGSSPAELVKTPEVQIAFNPFHLQDDDLEPPEQEYNDADSSVDSIEFEHHDTAHPSAAFILASQRASYDDDDDSFGSSNGDISVDAADEDLPPVHPFARPLEGDEFDDDSYDDDGGPEEETVFGVPPAQRLRSLPSAQNLRMLGEDLLQDTMGYGEKMAMAGQVEQSPTPWAPPS